MKLLIVATLAFIALAGASKEEQNIEKIRIEQIHHRIPTRENSDRPNNRDNNRRERPNPQIMPAQFEVADVRDHRFKMPPPFVQEQLSKLPEEAREWVHKEHKEIRDRIASMTDEERKQLRDNLPRPGKMDKEGMKTIYSNLPEDLRQKIKDDHQFIVEKFRELPEDEQTKIKEGLIKMKENRPFLPPPMPRHMRMSQEQMKERFENLPEEVRQKIKEDIENKRERFESMTEEERKEFNENRIPHHPREHFYKGPEDLKRPENMKRPEFDESIRIRVREELTDEERQKLRDEHQRPDRQHRPQWKKED